MEKQANTKPVYCFIFDSVANAMIEMPVADAKAEPGDAYRNQTRSPDGRLLAGTRIGDRLLNGGVNRGLIGHAFALKTAASLLGCGLHLQRFGSSRLALTVFLAGNALSAGQLSL